MAWTNAFDIGDCTLTVHKDGSATAMTAGEMTTAGVSLAADAAGLVTLTAPAITSGGGSYEVRVAPGFASASNPVRLTAITQDIADNNTFFPSWSPVPQDYSGGVYPQGASTTDTTYQFSPDQDWTFAGMAIRQVGI